MRNACEPAGIDRIDSGHLDVRLFLGGDRRLTSERRL
jgi:hypothetical protein